MGHSLRYLVRPLGRWRAEVLFRALGLSYLLDFVRTILPQILREGSLVQLFVGDTQTYPWSQLCGSLLLFTGARALPIAVAAVSCAAVVLQYELTWQSLHYDELVLVLLFLAAALVLARTSAGQPDPRAAFDAALCRLAQVLLVVAMAAVTLHKANHDFLGESSCFHEIVAGVADQWRFVPALHRLASPAAVIVADGASALLLLLAPRVGLVALFLAFTQWGLFGPVGSTLRIMFLAFGFLRPGDLDRLDGPGNGAGRRGRVALIATAAVLGTGFTLAAYRQPSNLPWLACFSVYLSAVTLAVLVATRLALADLRAGRSLFAPLGSARLREDLPRASRTVVAVAALLLLANEAAPYVGLKRNYTLKMWSNLRTDHERWNSLVVPEALRIFDRVDRQILVVEKLRVQATPRPLGRLRGTVSPRDVLRVIGERADYDGFELRYRYAGREHELAGRRGGEDFQKLVRRLQRLDGKGATLDMVSATARVTEGHRVFRHDLLSAVELFHTLRQVEPYVERLDIELRDASGIHAFPDAFGSTDLETFLAERIPWMGKVWLSGFAGRPQPCVH